MAEDRVHHPALAIQRVDQLELADQHRRLAGEHPRKAPRLSPTAGHPRDEEPGEAALDLNRDGEGVGRSAEQVEEGA